MMGLSLYSRMGGYRETGGARDGNVRGCGMPALPNGTMILADWQPG